MEDILSTTETKKSLTTLLININVLENHLKDRNIEYFISGNGTILSSQTGRSRTNHTEGETAIITGLCASIYNVNE